MDANNFLNKRLLTTDDLAKFLNLNTRSVRQMVDREEIPFMRINGWHIRFDPDAIATWLKTCENIPPRERQIWEGRRKVKNKFDE